MHIIVTQIAHFKIFRKFSESCLKDGCPSGFSVKDNFNVSAFMCSSFRLTEYKYFNIRYLENYIEMLLMPCIKIISPVFFVMGIFQPEIHNSVQFSPDSLSILFQQCCSHCSLKQSDSLGSCIRLFYSRTYIFSIGTAAIKVIM